MKNDELLRKGTKHAENAKARFERIICKLSKNPQTLNAQSFCDFMYRIDSTLLLAELMIAEEDSENK